MNIADVEINGDVLSVSIPRESLARECLFVAVSGSFWAAVAISVALGAIKQCSGADVPGIVLFCSVPFLDLWIFIALFRSFKSGKTYTFNRVDDTIQFNGKAVGKMSSIEGFEMDGMSRFASTDIWPRIWITFVDGPKILLLRTYTFGNIRFFGKLVGTRGDSLGEEAMVAGKLLCEVLSRFCERRVSA